jgi:hypothetical protein
MYFLLHQIAIAARIFPRLFCAHVAYRSRWLILRNQGSGLPVNFTGAGKSFGDARGVEEGGLDFGGL